MTLLDTFKVKIYADGPQRSQIDSLLDKYPVRGLTFNPALLRKNGIVSYGEFGREIAAAYPKLPISFEVIADTFAEIEIQAHKIAAWGDNVYVKVPVTLTSGQSTYQLLEKLVKAGLKVNVTAICTCRQIRDVIYVIGGFGIPAVVSIFAGRISDTGVKPNASFAEARRQADLYNGIEVLWASARRIYDIFDAEHCACDIITLPPDLIAKLDQFGKDLEQVSLETVQMFYQQAQQANFVL